MTMPPTRNRRGLANDRGFTLIELLVVVGLIGILSALALQTFSGYKRRAHDARAMHDLGNAITAEESYYAEHSEYIDVPATIGPAKIGTPGFVVSAQVKLGVDGFPDRFVATATSLLGTGIIYEFDSQTGVIRER